MKHISENLHLLFLFIWDKLELEAAIICFWSMATIITHIEKLIWSVFVGIVVLYIKSWLMRRWPHYFNPTKKDNTNGNP